MAIVCSLIGLSKECFEMNIRSILDSLFERKALLRSEARILAAWFADGSLETSQVGACLSLMSTRPFSRDEVLGFRDTFIERSFALDFSEWDPLDVCGTGGDGKHSFNISTASALLLAAAGVKLAKHGNYAVSSLCGSSNLLEAMGYVFKSDESALKVELEKRSICFIHAPLFHPAMKFVAPVRKALGIKTIFNCLGPLLNPAKVRFQLSGVFSLPVFRIYDEVLRTLSESNGGRYCVVHSSDGSDEVSLSAPCHISTPEGRSYLEPSVFPYRGEVFPYVRPEEIKSPESMKDRVLLMEQFLKGEAPKGLEEVILVNAALAYCTRFPEVSLGEARSLLRESLLSGKAYKNTKLLLEMQ